MAGEVIGRTAALALGEAAGWSGRLGRSGTQQKMAAAAWSWGRGASRWIGPRVPVWAGPEHAERWVGTAPLGAAWPWRVENSALGRENCFSCAKHGDFVWGAAEPCRRLCHGSVSRTQLRFFQSKIILRRLSKKKTDKS